MSKASSTWPSSPDTPTSDADSNATTLCSTNASPKKSFDQQNDEYGSISKDDIEHSAYAAFEDEDEDETALHNGIDQAEVPLLTTTDALPVEEDERAIGTAIEPPHPSSRTPQKPQPVSWMSLPRKDQLVILTLARLSEPLTQTSLQSYMFYQLRSFSPSAPDSTISNQAGLLQAAFTGAQFCTAILWGRMADSERMGRKKVILIGLLGTAIGAVGFGFSSSFAAALCWRFLGGGECRFSLTSLCFLL